MMAPNAMSAPRPTGPARRTYTASPISTPSTKKAIADSSCSRPDRASRTSPRAFDWRRDPDGGVSTAVPEREEAPDFLPDPEGLVLAIT